MDSRLVSAFDVSMSVESNLVNFSDANPGDDAYTYEEADGEMIGGEFGWVSDLEYFDERDGEVRLIRKRWRLIEVHEVVLPDPYPVEDDDDGEAEEG